jgi:KaiC/GvpD/RAD55 family RecA-like ATPase
MRVSTGVPGLDRVVEGGLPANRLYVISGPPGSGKTTFCSQFMTQGVRDSDDCLYVTMHETKAELQRDMGGYEFGFDRALDSGAVTFLNLMTEQGKEMIAQFGSQSGLAGRLLGAIEDNDVDRVVIDSTMLLDHFLEGAEDEVTGFISELKQLDSTIVLVSEMTDPSCYADEHYLAHGVVFFHNFLEDGGMTRGVQVIKMRGTSIDADIRHIEFGSEGLSVHSDRKVET